MKLSTALDIRLKNICPIIGVSIGREDDNSTWRIDFADSATTEQKRAAMDLVDSFVFDDGEKKHQRKSARNKDADNNLELKGLFRIEKRLNPDLTMSEYLDSLESEVI